MKRILHILMMLVSMGMLASCGISGISGASKEDKDLFKAITAIEKRNHAEARKDLPALYQQSIQRHEDRIASYKHSSSPNRWQNIIAELEALQKIYTAVNGSAQASKLVSPQNYATQIREAREYGAQEYYELGVQYLQSSNRLDARKAYDAFRTANSLLPNYKNTSALLSEAREKGILDVVINPVQTRGYSYANWGFTADNFQRNLVRDLGGSFGNNFSGARFYTDWEARSRNVEPDWIVDLNWENVYISHPHTRTYSRQVSKQIEIGKDTSGRPVYRTVNATLHITQQAVNARADMEYRVSDIMSNDNIEWNRLPAYLDLNIEHATYRGDSRALSEYDWALVNNRQRGYFDESDIMEALYARIYPQLRSRIENVTRW